MYAYMLTPLSKRYKQTSKQKITQTSFRMTCDFIHKLFSKLNKNPCTSMPQCMSNKLPQKLNLESGNF